MFMKRDLLSPFQLWWWKVCIFKAPPFSYDYGNCIFISLISLWFAGIAYLYLIYSIVIMEDVNIYTCCIMIIGTPYIYHLFKYDYGCVYSYLNWQPWLKQMIRFISTVQQSLWEVHIFISFIQLLFSWKVFIFISCIQLLFLCEMFKFISFICCDYVKCLNWSHLFNCYSIYLH